MEMFLSNKETDLIETTHQIVTRFPRVRESETWQGQENKGAKHLRCFALFFE